jgi:hypothetical protein
VGSSSATGEVGHVAAHHGVGDRATVGRAGASPRAEVRVATHLDQFPRGDGERGVLALRHHADGPGELGAGPPAERAPPEAYLARVGRQRA